MTRRALTGVGLLCAGLLVTACAPQAPDVKVQPGVDPAATAETGGSPEQVAVDRAIAAVTSYQSALDTMMATPGAYLDGAALSPTADGSAVTGARIRAGSLQRGKRKQVGATQLTGLRQTKLALVDKPDATPRVYPSVQLSGCIDRSQVSVVDASGATVADPATKSVRATWSVRNTAWPDTNAWRVAWVKESTKAC